MYLRNQSILNPHHQCQIDCSNPTAVINNLQVKSKDLYYFWRNYEWLYNKYYSILPQLQQLEAELVTHRSQSQFFQTRIQTLQSEINHLRTENNHLVIQINSIKPHNSQLEEEYKIQINRNRNVSAQYEVINEKQLQQISILKTQMKTRFSGFEGQIRTLLNSNIDLQRTIDQLRLKLNLQVPIIQTHTNTEEINAVHERYQIQIRRLHSSIRILQESIERIINEQMQGARHDLLLQLPTFLVSSISSEQDIIINTL